MWILRPTINCFLSLLVFSECSRRDPTHFQSPETPLAEEQQVMSNVPGGCHLKMDEDQKSVVKGELELSFRGW